MKKISTLIGILVFILSQFQSGNATASEKPVVVSFKMSPESVEVSTGAGIVTFDLVVSNPTGIYTTQTQVKLTDGGANSIDTTLIRVDNPVDLKLTTVTFHGSISIPANFPNGVYTASAKPITAANSDGTAGYATDSIDATTSSKVVGAENTLLVRKGGDLNYKYSTFVGPAYDKTKGFSFVNPKFNAISAPIWKVGESIDLNNYYELEVPSTPLKLTSNSISVCSASEMVLKLLTVGTCSFTVSTVKTLDYQEKKDEQVVSVSSARIKPTYVVGSIPTQSSTTLPITIAGPFINSPMGLIQPVSATPSVCYAVGTYITVISGGTCTLNYSSPESVDYLGSDKFPLSFEITRSSQTLTFNLLGSTQLSTRTLNLTALASSGMTVSYSTSTPDVCSTNGSTLNLLKAGLCKVTASQIGSTTVAPVSTTQSITVTSNPASVKKILCVKNGRTKVFLSKKCPTGYNPKK